MSSGMGRILTGDPNDLLYLKEKSFMGKFIDKSRNFSEQYINDYNHLPIRFLRRKSKKLWPRGPGKETTGVQRSSQEFMSAVNSSRAQKSDIE